MFQEVKGWTVDSHTRCVHYHSALDVIAIKFKCCQTYYPCHQCHEETAGHSAVVWAKKDYQEKVILCGICKSELTITEYLSCNNRCPNCDSEFNPGCANHYHLYFES